MKYTVRFARYVNNKEIQYKGAIMEHQIVLKIILTAVGLLTTGIKI